MGGKNQCGMCDACRSRREGFVNAGVKDPTVYECDLILEAGS